MTARPPKITNHAIVFVWPGFSKSQVFYSDGCSTFRNFVPPAQTRRKRICKTRRQAMLRNLKVMSIVVVVIVLAVSTYAFAAANTVPATKAGDGSGAISGYTVSAVGYNLNATDPTLLDSVDFTLSDAATQVQIKLVAAGSTWYTCTIVTGNNWTCDTTGATVLSMDELQVIAASN
jgi:hypothetical protein